MKKKKKQIDSAISITLPVIPQAPQHKYVVFEVVVVVLVAYDPVICQR